MQRIIWIMYTYVDEAVGSGSVCRYSSMGREYTRPSFLSVNATSA
jgi:hypothetical protein